MSSSAHKGSPSLSPTDLAIGMNYFPLIASDYQCKEELQFTLRPLPNACKLEGDLWKFFWAMVVVASYPGSLKAGAERRAWYTLSAHASNHGHDSLTL